MKPLIILAITIFAISCTQVKYQSVELPLPPPIPEKDRLTQEELECVSDSTLNKIILIDKRRKTLRGIIKSTHTK